jgi:PAS domain S-box-containing protein
VSGVVALNGSYDYRLVFLSVLIAVLAAYAALDLGGRVTTQRGWVRVAWLCCGAIAMGFGIWAMHYVGMEAFHLPVRVMYDWPTVLLSLLMAVAASGVALLTVSRPNLGRSRTMAGALFMGGGIAAMHYIGMEAMRLPAMCTYSPGLVGLSIFLAVAISYVAIKLTFALRGNLAPWSVRKLLSALVMGLAIPTMHYVGMAAVTFMPLGRMNRLVAHAVDVSNVGLACIALVAVLLLGLVFATSIVDRRFSLQAQQLAKSQLQLQTIFDNMTEGILVLDSEGKTVLVNPAAIRLLSMGKDSPNYQSVLEQFEACTTDGQPLPSKQWPTVRALRGEFVQNYEMLYRHKSTGETGAREISTAPVGDGFGGTGQVVITYRDITERRQMDEARNRLAAIVESSEDAIISKSDTGIVTSWNRGAQKLFGYAAEEIIGRSITRLLPEDRLTEEADILRRIKLGETVEHIETVRKAKNGTSIQVSLTISPIRDANGRVVGASKIARNITERKQLQSQLYQSQKMEAIGQLTGGIAHDFNNLLGVILGNLDLLEMMVDENEGALKRVRTAQTAASRGADLIRRLLATSSNVDWLAAPAKLQDSVRNMMDLAHTLGPEIKITVEVDDQMPSVLVDAAGLESALLNLAVNARDAMPQGGTLTVSTQLSDLEESYPPVLAGELKAGRYACVSVSDTGHGMSTETLARVFEPFFTTKPRGKGTGLGLAMVYGFAKQSGGTVRIYSEPGYGTTVSLYLPLAKEMADTDAPVVWSPASEKGGEQFKGTALVVDDEAELVDVAKIYLQDMGYTVYHAPDGASALALAEAHPEIDLMVTDILMPGGMNGAELAKKVRESLKQVKIIYCSGFPANSLAERSMSLSDGPLLHKPYQRAALASLVRAVMGEQDRSQGRPDGKAASFAEEVEVSGELVSGALGGWGDS